MLPLKYLKFIQFVFYKYDIKPIICKLLPVPRSVQNFDTILSWFLIVFSKNSCQLSYFTNYYNKSFYQYTVNTRVNTAFSPWFANFFVKQKIVVTENGMRSGHTLIKYYKKINWVPPCIEKILAMND